MATLVQIYAKPPVPGLVKTRVAKQMGNQFACELHKLMLEKIIEVAISAADNVEIWTTEALDQCNYFSGYPLPVFKQRGNDLGQRMHWSLKQGLKRHSEVAIIGADAYSLSAEDVCACFHSLQTTSVALVPALDGGYVLLAAKQWPLKAFDSVEWGSERVLKQTIELLKRGGVSYSLLPTRWDIDTVQDIRNHAPGLIPQVEARCR